MKLNTRLLVIGVAIASLLGACGFGNKDIAGGSDSPLDTAVQPVETESRQVTPILAKAEDLAPFCETFGSDADYLMNLPAPTPRVQGFPLTLSDDTDEVRQAVAGGIMTDVTSNGDAVALVHMAVAVDASRILGATSSDIDTLGEAKRLAGDTVLRKEVCVKLAEELGNLFIVEPTLRKIMPETETSVAYWVYDEAYGFSNWLCNQPIPEDGIDIIEWGRTFVEGQAQTDKVMLAPKRREFVAFDCPTSSPFTGIQGDLEIVEVDDAGGGGEVLVSKDDPQQPTAGAGSAGTPAPSGATEPTPPQPMCPDGTSDPATGCPAGQTPVCSSGPDMAQPVPATGCRPEPSPTGPSGSVPAPGAPTDTSPGAPAVPNPTGPPNGPAGPGCGEPGEPACPGGGEGPVCPVGSDKAGQPIGDQPDRNQDGQVDARDCNIPEPTPTPTTVPTPTVPTPTTVKQPTPTTTPTTPSPTTVPTATTVPPTTPTTVPTATTVPPTTPTTAPPTTAPPTTPPPTTVPVTTTTLPVCPPGTELRFIPPSTWICKAPDPGLPPGAP